MEQRRNCAILKDAKIKFKREECALGMGQVEEVVAMNISK